MQITKLIIVKMENELDKELLNITSNQDADIKKTD